jgi:hypothetical protein
MWFRRMIKILAELGPGGPISGKGRILDGKEDEWSDMKFKAPRC